MWIGKQGPNWMGSVVVFEKPLSLEERRFESLITLMIRIRGFVLGHCNTRNKHLLTVPQLCTFVSIKLY